MLPCSFVHSFHVERHGGNGLTSKKYFFSAFALSSCQCLFANKIKYTRISTNSQCPGVVGPRKK